MQSVGGLWSLARCSNHIPYPRKPPIILKEWACRRFSRSWSMYALRLQTFYAWRGLWSSILSWTKCERHLMLVRDKCWVSEWFGVLRHFGQFFSHIVTGLCLWQIIRVLPHSAASLEYRAANDLNTDTPPSHIILTLGQPVVVLSS